MTEQKLAFDSDPFAADEGRKSLRTGVPAWPGVGPRKSSPTQEPTSMSEGLIKILEQLYRFLGDKLSNEDLQAVQALFSGPDTGTLNPALGQDQRLRQRVSGATPRTQQGQPVSYDEMFPHMHRLERS